MITRFTKKLIVGPCLVSCVLLGYADAGIANSGDANQSSLAEERNPDLDKRLGPGDLMDVATKWVSKQHKRLHLNKQTNLKFEPLTVSRDRFGRAHLRFRPIIKNIPVIGKVIILHIDDATRDVLSVQGFLDVEESVNTLPTINKGQAIAELAQEGINPGKLQKDAELVFFALTRNESRLAWSFDVKYSDDPDATDHALIYMDAHTGDILANYPQVNFMRNRNTYNSNGQSIYSPTLVRGENTPNVGGDGCLDAAHNNLGIAYDYYLTEHGRDSWDGEGGLIKAHANYLFLDENDNQLLNSAWLRDDKVFLFGIGGTLDDGADYNCVSTLDIVGHEFTHAVISSSAALANGGEPGALNEGIADALGAMTEYYGASHYGTTNSYTWFTGEGLFDNIYTVGSTIHLLRCINNPASMGGVDHYTHLSEPIMESIKLNQNTTYEIDASIYKNMGIPSLAFYLLAQGGSHPRGLSNTIVTGLGKNTAAHIWYDALAFMNPSETMLEARSAFLMGALDQTPDGNNEYSYDRNYLTQVANAWAAVGVGNTRQPDDNQCNNKTFSRYEELILDAYIAYYGRAGDKGGVDYWTTRMQTSGGNLDSIANAFSTSKEFDRRYGNLTNEQLVTSLYWQLFHRAPDPGGLNYYVMLLDTSARPFSSIALDILYGAIGGSDLDALNNRRTLARDYYVRQEANSLDLTDTQLAKLMRPITSSSSTATDACADSELINELTY